MADRPSRVERMTDEELLAIVARPTHDRAWNVAFISLLVVSVMAVTIALGDRLGGGWMWLVAIVLGLLLGWLPGLVLGVSILLMGVALTRRTRYRDELLRRAGWTDAKTELDRARRDIASEGGPATILIFDGAALPHGGSHFVRLDLWTRGERPSELRFQSLARAEDGSDPRQGLTRGDARLEADRIRTIAELLRSAAERPLQTASLHGVMDGFPFHLRLFIRGRPEASEVQGNLAASPRDERVHAIANGLLELARGAGRPTSLVGSTSFKGEIRIDER